MGVADFDIGDQLGEGAFGQVCLCMLRTTGMQYAIKIIEVIHAKRHGGLQQRLQGQERQASAQRALRCVEMHQPSQRLLAAPV